MLLKLDPDSFHRVTSYHGEHTSNQQRNRPIYANDEPPKIFASLFNVLPKVRCHTDIWKRLAEHYRIERYPSALDSKTSESGYINQLSGL